MTLIKRKQLDAVFDGFVRIVSVAATGSSVNVSTTLSAALSTAGRGGVAVPVQVAANSEQIGVVTAKRCEIFSAATGEKISDGNTAGNDEVYGKISEAAGIYTLAFFTNEDGTETAYTFASSTDIIVEFVYRYDFARLPQDFAVSLTQRNGSQDPNSDAGAKLQTEQLAVSGTNTIAALSKTPNLTSNLTLIANGVIYDTIGGASAHFSVSGKAITWSTVNAGFSIEVGDRVIAQYTTLE